MDTVQSRKLLLGTFCVYESPELACFLRSSYLLLLLIFIIKCNQKTNSFLLVLGFFFPEPLFFGITIQKSGVIRISNGRLPKLYLRPMHVINKIKIDICSRKKHIFSAQVYFLKNAFQHMLRPKTTCNCLLFS